MSGNLGLDSLRKSTSMPMGSSARIGRVDLCGVPSRMVNSCCASLVPSYVLQRAVCTSAPSAVRLNMGCSIQRRVLSSSKVTSAFKGNGFGAPKAGTTANRSGVEVLYVNVVW